jgi:hypothetical protein
MSVPLLFYSPRKDLYLLVCLEVTMLSLGHAPIIFVLLNFSVLKLHLQIHVHALYFENIRLCTGLDHFIYLFYFF